MEYDSFGTILAYGNGETPTEEFTKVAQVMDIDGPGMTRDTIDVTNHDSPGYAEFLAGMPDGGEVSFPIQYDPADASHDATTGLQYLLEKKTRTNFRLIYPVESPNGYYGHVFAGMLTAFKPKAPVKGSLTADITIKVSGKVELVDNLKGADYLC